MQRVQPGQLLLLLLLLLLLSLLLLSVLLLCVHITHSVVGGSGGMLPQETIMRVLLRPSETTMTTQKLWQLDYNLGDSPYGCFLETLPFGISLCM